MMERYLTVQTIQEIKELISDFRDIRKLRCLYHCTIGRKPTLFMAGSFIQGAMNKGIYYSRVSIDTPQPDGSVVKTRCIQTLGLYIIIPFGIILKRAASYLIMSLYLSNQVPT
jgi:hypothetical protein